MTAKDRAQSILDRHRALVDAEISHLLRGRADLPLYHMLRYHLGWSDGEAEDKFPAAGKRVRSTLCLLSCQASGGDPEAAAPAGAALELLHSFTLLHDDIVDEDEVRRGRPTVWRLWGVGQALTAGDAMYALANLALGRLSHSNLSPAAIADAARELNEAAITVCEGQHLDLAFEGRPDIGVTEYLDMTSRKTAALIAAALSIGARLAEAADETTDALRQFGHHLGVAYQIRDDILGLWGDPGQLGKPVGGDLRKNKRSLPVVYALASAEPEPRRKLAAHLAEGVPTDAAIARIIAQIEAAGARDYCDRLLRESQEAALTQLNRARLHDQEAEDLRSLAAYLMERSE